MQMFIGESAIYQEAKIIKHTPTKAIFRMVIQTADEVNQNKRLYPKKVLTDGMKQAEERIKDRKFFGEMDHPLLSQSGSEAYDGMRQTTVLLKEVCVIIRNYEWRGNKLVGELETLKTPNGRIALGLLEDKIGIGISLRGMASLENENGINVVQSPIFILAYDLVSLPSHKSAVVNFNEMTFESKSLITESCGTICHNGICYLPDYFDMLVETAGIKFFDRWV